MSNTVKHAPALIIGGGPAGYTAGIYLGRAKRDPMIIEGLDPGGQLMLTTEVENFPGFEKPILGPLLMQTMRAQAQHCGANTVCDEIIRVNFNQRPFECYGRKATYTASVVIIATGARTKWLGLESEAFFRGYGVSSCATCDGRFFRDKDIVIVGGGDSAAEEALFLARQVNHVTLVHRRDRLRASQIMQERLQRHEKISFIWDSVVQDIQGTDSPRAVQSVVIRNLKTEKITTLKASALFVAIGHVPNTEIFQSCLSTDAQGYIAGPSFSEASSEKENFFSSDAHCASATSVPGVFAAGDVKDKIYRQAITAAGQGCMAALDAERFLQEHDA